ncbi:hypothetical protein BJ742DRAFT_849554 [Cladochytrium replicatum]|nr:hypothetical protein BJ742DRAFT_849554 [Cladochytrium replicatum]
MGQARLFHARTVFSHSALAQVSRKTNVPLFLICGSSSHRHLGPNLVEIATLVASFIRLSILIAVAVPVLRTREPERERIQGPSLASCKDYAEATASIAAKIFKGEDVKKFYELGGQAFKRVEAYAKTLEGFGLPGPLAFIFAQSDEAASQARLYTDSADLADALGHAPEDWKAVVERQLK